MRLSSILTKKPTFRVVFSEKAFSNVCSEVREKQDTETGGILLGDVVDDVFYVVENIDPGPNSVFQVAYFEYDSGYTTHLANKVSRLYEKPLRIVGLWHRNPGSFSVFSSTDDGTNAKFAALNDNGAISALVNIDPEFRMTMYHVAYPSRYTVIPYTVEPDLSGRFPLKRSSDIIEDINTNESRMRRRFSLDFIERAIASSEDLSGSVFNTGGDDLESLVDLVSDDIQSLADEGLRPVLAFRDNMLSIELDGRSDAPVIVAFDTSGRPVIGYGGRMSHYSSGMLGRALGEQCRR